jgi:hypothetical protein
LICPVKRRIEDKKSFILDRFYPGKGRSTVKVGQRVEDTEIIAHCEVSAGQRLVKIAHALGVSGKDAQKFLTRKVGDRIYEGEVVARKKGLLGVGKKEIKSPVDGVVTEVDKRGDLILKFLPLPVRLLAGAAGMIKEVTEAKISIDTTGTRVHGFVSLGRERDGIIEIIGGPKEFILPNKITTESKGKILVGGALLEKSALEKAVTLGVEGIITGGMNYRDFDNLGGGEDIGTSIMVTEGFGSAPMGDDIWNFFKQKEGRLGFLLGSANQLVIPQELQGKDVQTAAVSSTWRELRVGDKVRYLRKESSDLLGEVKNLPGEQIINSGVLTDVSQVSFGSGQELLLPASNLEIIE